MAHEYPESVPESASNSMVSVLEQQSSSYGQSLLSCTAPAECWFYRHSNIPLDFRTPYSQNVFLCMK
jgi:hypothetical protein